MKFAIHLDPFAGPSFATPARRFYNVPGLPMNKQIWVGLAEVKPLPGCTLLEEARGAYVHVMAWAKDALEFRNRVALRAADLSLEVVSLSQTMPWTVRNSGDEEVRAEFYEMQDRIGQDVKAVAFGRFHAWLTDQPV